MNLNDAVVYDTETFPNCFTLQMEMLNSDVSAVWEISSYRDDRVYLMNFFQDLARYKKPMIGFNNLHFDYPIIDFIFKNPQCTVEQIYQKAMSIINNQERFGGPQIWPSDRFAPQIDLLKMHHFDNAAKSTSLKALQVNMRSQSVVDMPVENGTILTKHQIDHLLVPYGIHDVNKTKDFTHHSMEAINFRISLIPQFGVDVLNWPDTKIGSKIMESKLGDGLCYEPAPEGSFKKRGSIRQTPRTRIALNDIIFPYVKFNTPEFDSVLQYLKAQVLTTDQMKEFGNESSKLQTKGVFTDLKARAGGIDFYFGTGGIHGSVSSQRIVSGNGWIIRDIDVASLYPSIAIVNRLSPAHLGERFVDVYSSLPKERKEWQAKKGKKCVEANTLKLASNGVYGNSNNMYSPFYDPQFTMSITINGQLLLCMLAERLITVPHLKLIQINTDGVTYLCHENHLEQAKQIENEWQNLTRLTLEDTKYTRMWIRDVNNYIAESVDGSLKLKGAYWTPDPLDYFQSIANAQPPAWHKDLSNLVSTRAAVAAMVHGVQPESFIKMCRNPFDFMCRIKAKKSDNLTLDGVKIQKTSRYFISVDGGKMIKHAPPTGKPGAYKKKNGVSDFEYERVMKETNGAWDERVCSKNRSVYEDRETAIQAGFKLTLCNNLSDFDFDKLNYEWYVNEAKKLII